MFRGPYEQTLGPVPFDTRSSFEGLIAVWPHLNIPLVVLLSHKVTPQRDISTLDPSTVSEYTAAQIFDLGRLYNKTLNLTHERVQLHLSVIIRHSPGSLRALSDRSAFQTLQNHIFTCVFCTTRSILLWLSPLGWLRPVVSTEVFHLVDLTTSLITYPTSTRECPRKRRFLLCPTNYER